MLDHSERLGLLNLARESISRGFGGRDREPPAVAGPPSLLEHRATFTTLTLERELRGCCGSIEPQRPLFHDVWHSAWSSAYADPRFWPVSAAEIDLLEISISVLTPLEALPVRSNAELVQSLEPGVDGVVLRSGGRQATFLPAVWEMLPDPGDFVEALKQKAGWASSFWSPDITVFRYRTETFRAGRRNAVAA